MDIENYYLQDFNDAFADKINDYVLVGFEGHYSIINAPLQTMMIIEDRGKAEFFIDRLLNLGVMVYSNFADVPDLGSKKTRPPELSEELKEFIKRQSKR